MKLTGIQRVKICAQVLACGTLRNRYRFYRFVEERSRISAAVRALVSRIRCGV
jgi:hypothetical protein